MNFIQGLENLLKEKGITAHKMCMDLGFSKDAVFNWRKRGTIPSGETLQKVADYFGVTTDFLLGRENVILPGELPVKMVPVLGSVKAGLNGIAREEASDYYPAPASLVPEGEKHFYLIVDGDSMAPELNPGDMALVRRQNSVDSGTLGVFLIDGEEGVIKRVRYDTDYIELVSVNPEYPVRRFDHAEVLRVFVVGRVISVSKRY